MSEVDVSEPLAARGEAEGAQSRDEAHNVPQRAGAQGDDVGTARSMQNADQSEERLKEGVDEGEALHAGTERIGNDPLAEAAMNILRTQKQQMDLDPGDREDNDAFLDYGDSDSIGSGKHVEQIDCIVGSEQKATDIAKQFDDLHIDIPEPMVKLKRRSSSIAELSDVEATGSVERFSPREDPVGSAMGSLPLHATTPTSITSSSSCTTDLGGAALPSSAIPPIDPEAIQDLERQCHRVADNLNLMLGHLSNSLHNMSAITVGHIQTYRDAVEKAGITVDQSVKAMYALMAKVEELNFSMPLVYDLAKQIKSINTQLDELEALCK